MQRLCGTGQDLVRERDLLEFSAAELLKHLLDFINRHFLHVRAKLSVSHRVELLARILLLQFKEYAHLRTDDELFAVALRRKINNLRRASHEIGHRNHVLGTLRVRQHQCVRTGILCRLQLCRVNALMHMAEAVVENEDADQAESDEAMQIPQDLTVISIAVLDKMTEFAKTGDFEQVRTHLDRLKSYGYDGDNLEFLQALSEAAESENADMITELVNTYRDLKL